MKRIKDKYFYITYGGFGGLSATFAVYGDYIQSGIAFAVMLIVEFARQAKTINGE